MKKFGLLLLGGLAAIVLLHNLAPIVGMVISLAILYFVVKRFLKTDSILMKIGWGILGFMAINGICIQHSGRSRNCCSLCIVCGL